jgi:hypothetical protein
LRLHIHYHQTSSTALSGDQLEAEAEMASQDATVLLKACRDTLNSSRRDDEDTPARSEYRHADRPAGRINGNTAFRAPSHAQIEFDPSIDLAATQGPPRAGTAGYHSQCCGWPTVFSPDCDRERADRHGLCVKRNRRQVGTINPQDRDVGGMITSNEPSRERFTARWRDGEVAFLG